MESLTDNSSASGVSADGSVIVGEGYFPDLSGSQALRWTQGGHMGPCPADRLIVTLTASRATAR